MVLLKVIFLLLILSFSGTICMKSEFFVVSEAISAAFTSYFAQNCFQIDILFIGDKKGELFSIVQRLLDIKPDNVTVAFVTFPLFIRTSTVFIVESKAFFHQIAQSHYLMGALGGWYKHLVYVPSLTAAEIESQHKTNISLSEVDFLINFNGSSIDLATAFMYTEDKCGENQVRTINRFSVRTGEWENSNFYPDKYRDFHGCPLEVIYTENYSPMMEYKVFDELAAYMNFRVVRMKVADKTFHEQKFDKLFFGIAAHHDFHQYFVVSNSIYMDEMTIMVPAGEPLTDLEKMFVMFDDEIWIAIGSTFTGALVTIQVINQCHAKVQDFVYGWRIRTPTLNVISIFLSGAPLKLPGRNFARFLMMMFMIWCLIIRTCYQSKMFENLQSDMRHPAVESFDDFNEKNFTLLYLPREAGWVRVIDGR